MLANSAHVMTLANSIIGVGILAMPFCFQKCGIVLAVMLLIVSNWITRISCHYLIKSSILTRRKSFEFLGFHVFGPSGKLLAELCIIGYLFGTCVTYFVVVGDLGPQIIAKMFSLEEGYEHLRIWIMIGVTVVCILPLAMLKNVDSLSAVCTASVGFYVCLVIKIVLESEEHIISNDWTTKVVYWQPAGLLQCLPIFSMALSCQMQLFEVFESINNQSLEKLNSIVCNATWICTFVYIGVGFFGYVAFCTQAFSGNILMILSPSLGSDAIKTGFILSIAFSFPLVIFPCRASIYSLLYRKGHVDASGYIPETRFKVITTCIVGCALCIALMIPSVELIIGLVGSTIGVAICVMFPAACFRRIVKKESAERSLAHFILVSGFCLMILGTYANLNAIDEKSSGAHLELPQIAEQKINDNLIRPTEKIPPLNGELANDMTKEKQKLPNIEDKSSVGVTMQADAIKLANVQQADNVDKSAGAIPVVSKQDPLPVDEKHEPEAVATKMEFIEKVSKAKQELNVISPKPDMKIEELPRALNTSVVNNAPLKLSNDNEVKSPSSDGLNLVKNGTQSKVTQQQSIDRDAIKKDEEVAAEEQRNNGKGDNGEELKKTQNELKKTKELLERTVDELKEELAKQNKETQNLVVEKLGEVVEKVEQIERKVQQELPPSPQPPIVPAVPAVPMEEPKEKVAEKLVADVQPKVSILNILSEKPIVQRPPNAPAAPEVYEPLSYKTGELIEHARNGSKLEQRLPLPLALLLNASHVKLNETMKGKARIPKDITKNHSELIRDDVIKKPEVKNENSEQGQKVPIAMGNKENHIKISPLENTNEENVKAIRRDILQVSPTKLQELPSLQSSAEETLQRMKRSSDVESPKFGAIDSKIQRENCLTEPKMGTLLAHGMSNAIDFQIQSIGRDLKSVKEEEPQ